MPPKKKIVYILVNCYGNIYGCYTNVEKARETFKKQLELDLRTYLNYNDDSFFTLIKKWRDKESRSFSECVKSGFAYTPDFWLEIKAVPLIEN